jgi:hypothetical protein
VDKDRAARAGQISISDQDVPFASLRGPADEVARPDGADRRERQAPTGIYNLGSEGDA